MPHFELAGTRNSSDREKDEKTSSLLKRIMTISTSFNFFQLLRWLISFASHGSLSLLRSVPWVCEDALPRPFAEPTLPSLLTVKAANLRRASLSCKIGTCRNVSQLLKICLAERKHGNRETPLKLHQAAMIYDHIRSPVSFQCCARTGSPQSGILQLSGSVPGSLKLQRMSSPPCYAAVWSHPQSLPCKTERATHFRTALQQSYIIIRIIIIQQYMAIRGRSTYTYYTVYTQNYTKLHENEQQKSTTCAKLLLMHDHDGVDGPGITLEPQGAMKELFLKQRRSWELLNIPKVLNWLSLTLIWMSIQLSI